MSFQSASQWYHSHADPIWPDGTFKEPKNRFQGINSASMWGLVDWYDNPIPTRFLAPINCKLTWRKNPWTDEAKIRQIMHHKSANWGEEKRIKMLNQVYDQTRGPDSQIPIWVDRIKDIDFKKVFISVF